MVGEVGISSSDYWKLTGGEVVAIANGFQINREVQASYFREVVAMLYNTNAKKGTQKKAKDIWPLPTIDGYKNKPLTEAEKQRRKRIAANGFN